MHDSKGSHTPLVASRTGLPRLRILCTGSRPARVSTQRVSSLLHTGATAGLSSSAKHKSRENTAGRASSGPRPLHGFTLVELLVVITIIGILIAMLLPAVQSAQEAARRTRCANNLKQLGIALQAYHDAKGSLPMGYWAKSDSITEPWPNWPRVESHGNALHQILPFIEQQAIYDDLYDVEDKYPDYNPTGDYKYPPGDFRNPYGSDMIERHPEFGRIRRYRISLFVCPSDDSRRVNSYGYGLSSYAGSCGPSPISNKGREREPPCLCYDGLLFNELYKTRVPVPNGFKHNRYSRNGPFGGHNSKQDPRQPAIKFARIRDGLSNTIFIGEMRALCTGSARSGWACSTNGFGYIRTTVPINYDTCGHSSIWRDVNGCRTTCNGNVIYGFKSCHPGGAQFLFGDGSVSFLSEAIDGWSYQALGGVADQQPAPSH